MSAGIANCADNAPFSSGRDVAYARRARRIRATFRHDCMARHLALLELARLEDQVPPARPNLTPVQQFAQQVLEKLEGSLLRFSVRQQLLADARHMGIDRFDANLMIASLQHRAIRARPVTSRVIYPTRTAPWRAMLLTIAMIQAALLAGAWWLLR